MPIVDEIIAHALKNGAGKRSDYKQETIEATLREYDKQMKKKGSGGGLPDASDYADGTVLIAKDGAFVPSAGYGYLMPDTTLTWDGRYREGRDHLITLDNYGYYISPLQDMDIPSSDFSAVAETESDGESGSSSVQFIFSGESAAVYKSWMSYSGLMVYKVLSESFWDMLGASSLGTGLFLLEMVPSFFEDGDCVVVKDGPGESTVFYDSFNLTMTIPGAKQTIDRTLIGGLVYTVTVSGDRSTCDKTAEEIFEAYTNGPVHFVQSGGQFRYTTRSLLLRAKAPMYNSGSEYAFYVWHNDEGGTLDADEPGFMRIYTASAGNEHPTLYTTGSHEEPVI